MKKLYVFALGLLVAVGAQAEKEVYTVFDNATKTLTYYYDEWDAHNGDYKERYDPESQTARFVEYYEQVLKGRIDVSMKEAELTSMQAMFYGGEEYVDNNLVCFFLSAMTSIEGLENLNTANVSSMTAMFYGCKSLTSLDISHFNTQNVMRMRYMFASCTSLTSLDLSNLNTANVTDMNHMFSWCSSLTSLDLTTLNVSKVTSMGSMFYGCGALTTLYCNEDWSRSPALESSEMMFSWCYALKGDNGTTWSMDFSNSTYARPDMPGQPGYFTKKADYHYDNGWVYYDDGQRINNFGPGNYPFYWAVMYPANTLDYTELYKIGFFTTALNTEDITVSVANGGDNPSLGQVIYRKTYNPDSYVGMFTVEPEGPISFDNTKNLWIMLNAPSGYPATICANTGDPNTRWYSMDGTTWGDLATTSAGGQKNDYSFMIRACFDANEAIDQVVNSKSSNRKFIKDGQLLIERDGKLYNATGTQVK